MSISDKTRKILWARSGNRCVICKCELIVSATSTDSESVIGAEAHIVSGQTNGPRNESSLSRDKIDSYENLILLCQAHHKMVDDQCETYNADILRQMKINHEKWVSKSLDGSSGLSPLKLKRLKSNVPEILTRLTTGKEVLNIVCGAYAYSFDHDELQNEEEVSLVGGFLQAIQDWGDFDFEAGYKVRVGFELTQYLKELEDAGFFVFGAREVQILDGGVGGPSDWPVAIIQVARKTNSLIKKVPLTEVSKQG